MQTWAVANQKGGAAKTTTTVSLAAALAERGKKVLVIDLDPQAAASSWLGVKDDTKALLDLFTNGGGLVPLVHETTVPGVELIPSSTWLVGAERAVVGEPGAETIFRRAVGKLPKRWDLVLVDCPPSLAFLSVSALVAASAVLIPVEASALGLAGLTALLQTVETVQDRLNPELRLAGIVACRVDTRTNLGKDVVVRLREAFPRDVFKTTVRESVRLAEAWSYSQAITQYAPSSSGAEDYRALAAEVLTRVGRN